MAELFIHFFESSYENYEKKELLKEIRKILKNIKEDPEPIRLIKEEEEITKLLQNEIKRDQLKKTNPKPKIEIAGNAKSLGITPKSLNFDTLKGQDGLGGNKGLGTKKK